jgi:hypothetical protein
MKLLAIILSALCSTALTGQNAIPIDSLLIRAQELKVVTQVPDSIFDKTFYKSSGVHGDNYIFRQSSNFEFQHGVYQSNSGHWTVTNKGVLSLNSANHESNFYLMTLNNHFYYLVDTSQLVMFIERYRDLKTKFNSRDTVYIDNKPFSSTDRIASELAPNTFWLNWLD